MYCKATLLLRIAQVKGTFLQGLWGVVVKKEKKSLYNKVEEKVLCNFAPDFLVPTCRRCLKE